MCPNKGLTLTGPKEKSAVVPQEGLSLEESQQAPGSTALPHASLLGFPSGLCFALYTSIFSQSRAIFSSTFMHVAALCHPPNPPHIHIDR